MLIPVLLTEALIAIDMRTDLSALKAKPGMSVDGFLILGWEDLTNVREQDPVRALMLGYMMDGPRPVADGQTVETFTLMPAAGHLLHPAHRDSEEMVDVWLTRNQSISYADRRLVRVSGVLRKKEGRVPRGESGYTMANAAICFVADRSIRDWFMP